MKIEVKKLEIKNINTENSFFFSNFSNTFSSPTDEVYRLDQVNELI